jgi:hypothetical protein
MPKVDPLFELENEIYGTNNDVQQLSVITMYCSIMHLTIRVDQMIQMKKKCE